MARLAALRKVAGNKPIPQFIAALRGGDLPAAKTAAMGLCDRRAIVGPLRELLRDGDPCVRWRACALAWFFMIKEFVPDLMRALRDPDPMVRAEAAWAMRCAGTDAAARALLRATRDDNRVVAHYAAWTLRQIIKVKCPHLPSLKRARIPELPLLPERSRKRPSARAVQDDAVAFRQFLCSRRLPGYRAPLVEAPKADGRRDACYARADAAVLMHIDGYPEPPLRKTDFRVVCSPDALHFHIRCQYRSKKELAAKHTAYGQPVYMDNSVEVFLEPTGTGCRRYFQICLNTRNARRDVVTRSRIGQSWRPQPRATGDENIWRPGRIQTAVRVEKGRWNAELTVPFAEMGLTAGKVNKLWRMNITRNAHLDELTEMTSWCEMGDYDSHWPERFGYLWVDAGNVVNADADIFQTEPLPITPKLKGWTVLRGDFRVRRGEIAPVRGGGLLRWDTPIPFEDFELAAEVQIRHQIRLLFSPDRRSSSMSFMAAYINRINEINVATMRNWDCWSPPLPGQLSIFKEVYPPLTHSRWYEVAVRVRKDRLQCLLDGAVQMELPNPRPGVRYFGLGFVAGGKARKLRFRRL